MDDERSSGKHHVRRRPSVSLSAGALTQLLAAFACFLGAFVLPHTFPVFRGTSQTVLVALGCFTLFLGTANLLFGRQMNRLMARFGRRSRVVVPREGLGYLAIMLTLAVGALLGQQNMPLLVFGMMAGPFILNGWIVYGMLKGITVRRRVAERASVGEFVVVEVTAANSKRLLSSHLLEVRDQVSGAALATNSSDVEGIVTFVRVPPRQSRTGRYELKFASRGRYQFGPARVSSRFPLGIGERGQVLSESDSIVIHPRIGRLTATWTRQQKELAESSRRTSSRPGLFDDEFHRIRDYRTDDNPRSIHWRSSARRGELMVREFQQNRRSDSLIILHLPGCTNFTEQEIETAISLAATLCVEQTRTSSGTRFLLGIAAAENTIISSRQPGGFREDALDALAMCQPSTQTDLHKLLIEILEIHSIGDDRIVFITPEPDEANTTLRHVSEQMLAEHIDLVSRTTVVPADAASLSRVLMNEDETSTPSPATVYAEVPQS